MDPLELEHLIDRELKRLPAPRAPETLLPRVMLAVRASAPVPATSPAPGWQTWPLAWQAASLAALVLLVLGAMNVWPVIHGVLGFVLASSESAAGGRVAEIAQEVEAIASAGRVVWRVLVQPMAVFAFVVLGIMVTACAVFGTALDRVALGGASRV